MIIKILIRVLVTAGTLLLISEYVPGITVASFYTAVIVALLWGILMLIVRPILTILTLPITLITLGLFSFVLNALLFWFLGTFVEGFTVAGFLPALEGSVILAIVAWVLHRAL